jgi:subtilase family serine protease
MRHSFVRGGLASVFSFNQWHRLRAFAAVVVVACGMAVALPLHAQTPNRVTRPVDITEVRSLRDHVPAWANSRNLTGSVPPDLMLDQMTMVLSRSSEQELVLEKFMADQQDPASPNYHHWLTPTEFGDRFGLSEQDTASVTAWLQSQGLQVNWISPSRTFLGFKGTASDVGRTFQTKLHYYAVNGMQRISVSSDPMLPAALAPVIKSIHGLYTVHERPMHRAGWAQSPQPEDTPSGGSYYIAPADFATIYDLPSNLTGEGVTIGIVGRSRTDFADFDNFKLRTGSTFADPTEIIATAFGGADPGAALTSKGAYTEDQLEATLDVTRAGSVAPGANLLLVIATNASGGIWTDAQYLVHTSPLPAQVMSISFGECEYLNPSAAISWDGLFQQAAAEGISVFVSSGDAGASGCDINFASPPPANPQPNSPNFICSSSYATCLGGTEFNDTTNPSLYWNSFNGGNLLSALSYIPEGGWNEPLNSNSQPQVASSGGGVSTVIPTPSWQTGPGVPAARSGRYTPDISFSASCHDGYFACFAAAGNTCVGSPYHFEYFCGTSAAAPDMAGVAALLDQQLGAAQGNLNPRLYAMAANAATASAFHDVTVATSGVANCSISTPSMCNNSIPGPTGLTGGQAGYPVTTGYDIVTGLGSLDVGNFISFAAKTPTITWANPANITYGTALTSTQLNATATVGGATVGGTWAYSPPLGTVLNAGNGQTLSVTFTPTDAADFKITKQVTINVSPAPLTVTANDAVRAPGASNPTLTYMITGFVNGETSAVVSGTASLATTATTSSPVGAYPITFSTENLTTTNYSFTYVGGVLEVYNASQPLALGLSPGSAVAGGAGFTLTVNGANFATNSVVLWNGAKRATTYVSGTQLTAAILAQDIAKESTGLLTVANPAPNPGTLPAQPFAVISATPVATMSDSSIAIAADGSGNHVLTLTGTDFVSGSVVQWNGTSLTTNYVSPWQVSAAITTAEFATQPAAITVNNASGTSAVFELQ